MQRRAFLAYGGQTTLFALGAGIARSHLTSTHEEPPTRIDLEQRVASVIATYDAQGNHRTGTAVDRQSGEWLAAQMRQLGVEPVLEPFTLDRIDLRSCYIRVAGRRIDGVPLFDAGFTGPEGVQGVVGSLGSDADIAVVESQPPRLENDPVQRDHVEEARRGLYLLKSPFLLRPLMFRPSVDRLLPDDVRPRFAAADPPRLCALTCCLAT